MSSLHFSALLANSEFQNAQDVTHYFDTVVTCPVSIMHKQCLKVMFFFFIADPVDRYLNCDAPSSEADANLGRSPGLDTCNTTSDASSASDEKAKYN